jgi:hypothetical protein
MTKADTRGRPTGPRASTSMNDTEAFVANPPPTPVQSQAASTRLAIYYALLVTQTVSLIGSQTPPATPRRSPWSPSSRPPPRSYSAGSLARSPTGSIVAA